MLDKLLEITGLYFHDVAGVSLAAASGAVAVFAIAGLIGNALIVPALEKVRGLRVIRVTAIIVLIAYAAMLITPAVWIKYALIAVISFSTAGWFAILRAKCFEMLPGQSGLVIAATSLVNVVSLFVPVILGGIADALGLQAAMWLLAIGPVALIIGVR
jgi:FSR family fosmidomycin resistance protein-like MFS transporter